MPMFCGKFLKQYLSLKHSIILSIIIASSFAIVAFFIGLLHRSIAIIAGSAYAFTFTICMMLLHYTLAILRVNPTRRYTYSFKRRVMMVSIFSSVFLFVAIGFNMLESIKKLCYPIDVDGSVIAITMSVALILNAFLSLLLWQYRDENRYVNAAFIYVNGGLLVNSLSSIGGVILHFTCCNYIDSILALVINVVVIGFTWHILRDSLRISLDGMPEDVEMDIIKQKILLHPNIVDCYHLHIWALSQTEYALAAKVVVNDYDKKEEIRRFLRKNLYRSGMSYLILELEYRDFICKI